MVTRLSDFFERLGSTFSYKSSPNILVNFWAISNNTTVTLKMGRLLFGQYWEKLGMFLFHHLVTLVKRNLRLVSASKFHQRNWAIPDLFFIYFRLFNTVDNKHSI